LQSAKQEVSQIVKPQGQAVNRLKGANVMQTNADLLLKAKRNVSLLQPDLRLKIAALGFGEA
jgi:hypothetical protein